MRTFKVYPKEGEPFPLTCERFELNDNRFILYSSIDKESADGFLSFPKIAAIVPEKQEIENWPYPKNPIHFLVYLKDQPKPLEVFAYTFKTDDAHVTFFGQETDIMGTLQQEWPLREIYVATSELLAILPADGLVRRD